MRDESGCSLLAVTYAGETSINIRSVSGVSLQPSARDSVKVHGPGTWYIPLWSRNISYQVPGIDY